MFNPTKSHNTRTVILPCGGAGWLRAAEALTHQAKNLYNIGNHAVRQVLSAYTFDTTAKVWNLKGDLHPQQQQAIAAVNAIVDAINAKRREVHPTKVAKAAAQQRSAPALKILPRLETAVAYPDAIVLDATVLDNVMRRNRTETGESVYQRLPAVAAQQVANRLGDAYKGYRASLRSWRSNPKTMTGRPRTPGYLGRNDKFVLEFPFVSLSKGTLPEPRETRVPENDFATPVPLLPQAALRAFYDHNIQQDITAACRRRGWKDAQPQHLRLVPLKHKGIRLEVVVRIPNAYPADSFLATFTRAHEQALSEFKTQAQRETWVAGYLGRLPAEALPRLAGIDLGISNLATVAYATGHRAGVHMGGRFIANLEIFTDRIAKRVSEITPQRLKDLQEKKVALLAQKQRLPLAEEIELRSLLKEIYADQEYRRLVAKRNRWRDDYLHKLSRAIVDGCATRGIDVIVIGRNKLWKQQIALGTEQNRKFCGVAHATFIQRIRYKAESLGIAVLETEESYTSKTSFVNNDVLHTYEETHFSKDTQTSGDEERNTGIPSAPVIHTGKRSSADRNWFRHANRKDRWDWVHADVNGAMNIVRKICKSFAYHGGLTLKFDLFRLSPRLGVTPWALQSSA